MTDLFFILRAFGQMPQTFLPGMQGEPSNVIAQSTIPAVAGVMARIAGGAAVVFIVWAGMQMLLSWGDESKIGQARTAVIYAFFGVGLALTSQLLASVVVGEASGLSTVTEVSLLATAVRMMVTLFNSLFFVAITVAGIRMLLSHGKPDEFGKARTMVAWAIGGAIIVNLGKALVQAAIGFF